MLRSDKTKTRRGGFYFLQCWLEHFSKLKRLVQGANPQAVHLVRQGEATQQSPL